MQQQQYPICVMGMGYVGLTLSVILAEVGYDVYGIDVDENIIDGLKQGRPHLYEKNLPVRLLQQVRNGRLHFFTTAPDIYFGIVIISVGTPLKKENREPNLSHLHRVIQDVSKLIDKGTLVCMRSTIPVGCTRGDILPVLEQNSGKEVGKDFYLAFTPERTVEGNALRELRENSQIVGGITSACTEKAANFFLHLTSTVVTVSSIEIAEFSKIIDNCYRDMKFSFANEMALISENMGLDIYEVIKAANVHYPRNNIPVPSPGVGGTCLSKDPHILINLANRHGYQPKLIAQARSINESYPGIIVQRIKKRFSELGGDLDQATVVIAGFAFKGNPETADLRDSTTLSLLSEFRLHSTCTIKGYDAIVDDTEIAAMDIEPVTIPDGFHNADILIVANNHESFRDWDISEILSTMKRPAVIYDGWRMLNRETVEKTGNTLYLSPGL